MCRSERISRSGRDDQQSVGGTKRGTTKLAAAATATVGSFSQRQSSASSQDAKPGRHHGFVGSGRQRSWHGQRRQRDGRFSSETTGHQHPTSSVAICKLFQRRATNEFQPWTNPSKVRSIFFFLNFYFFFPIEFASADAFDSWLYNSEREWKERMGERLGKKGVSEKDREEMRKEKKDRERKRLKEKERQTGTERGSDIARKGTVIDKDGTE